MLSPAPGGRSLTSSRYSRPISLPASITAAQSGGRSIFEVKSGPPLPRTSVSPPSQFSAFLKKGRHLVPDPAAIAELGPVVEILGLAADIDQPVDRAGAAEHPAARVEDRAPGGAGIGLGVIPQVRVG